MVPHWDTGVNRRKKTKIKFFSESAIDVLAGFVIAYAIIQLLFPGVNLLYAFIVIIAAQSFDWLTAPYLFFKIKTPPFFYWSYRAQIMFDHGTDKLVGKYAQISFLIFVLILGKIL